MSECEPCCGTGYEVLFGPRQPGFGGPGISHVIVVTDDPVAIVAYNFPPGGCGVLERVEDHCGETFIAPASQPGMPCMHMCEDNTYLLIYVPGTYRLRLENVADPEAVLITQSKITPGVQFVINTGGTGMACGPQISCSVNPADGTLTLVVDGQVCSVTPGAQVTITDTPTHHVVTVDGVPTLIAKPMPSVVTNNGDGTLTHAAGGVSTTFRRGGPSADPGNMIGLGSDGLVALQQAVVDAMFTAAATAHEASLDVVTNNAGAPAFRVHQV